MQLRVPEIHGTRPLIALLPSISILAFLALTVIACASNAQHRDQPSQFYADGRAVLEFPASLHIEIPTTLPSDSSDDIEASWEVVSGPGEVRFDQEDTLSTTISFDELGYYVLRFEASNGQEEDRGDVEVLVVEQGSIIFVAPNGSNRNSGRSEEAPYRTIARAARNVEPGNVVLLRGGTYYEYTDSDVWVTSGEPDRPITFMSFPGEQAIIDGSEVTRSPTSTNPSAPTLIRIRDRDWYVFDDLVFRNSAGRGLSLVGNHNVFRNITSHGNHGDALHVSGDFNLIEDSVLFDNYSVSNGGDSADGLKVTQGEGNVVRRVVAYNNSDDGIDVWASTNALIEYSVAYDNGRGETGNGNGFKLSRGGMNSGNVVRFNVAFNNRAHNFTDNGGGDLLVYNNTSWGAGERGFVFRGREGLKGSELINNISFEDEAGVLLDIQIRGGVAPISRTNTWDLGIDDPEFVSLDPSAAGFLRLSEDSPARDAGSDVGVPFSGSAMDLGAFPYSTGSSEQNR